MQAIFLKYVWCGLAYCYSFITDILICIKIWTWSATLREAHLNKPIRSVNVYYFIDENSES